ncbi:MAG: hypothetical protein KatS3mg102_1227 [Planctomycetota bacterium]|nr:MAG: hypothetical protein KatS3mg102_1227 [Planctomycetota bacterium]
MGFAVQQGRAAWLLAVGLAWSAAGGCGFAEPPQPTPPARAPDHPELRRTARTISGERDSLTEYRERLEPVLRALERASRFPASGRGGPAPAAPLAARLASALSPEHEPRQLWARFEHLLGQAPARPFTRVHLVFARRRPGAEPERLSVRLDGRPATPDGAPPVLERVGMAAAPAGLSIEIAEEDGVWIERVQLPGHTPYTVASPELGELVRELERRLFRPLVESLPAEG